MDKKGSILLILKVLEKYSDKDHRLTYQQIIDLMQADYGVSVERKSVASSIELLIELGYEIDKSGKSGCALVGRLFEDSEIRFIDDAIFSSKAISGKYANNITNRLNDHLSIYQKRDYSYLVNSNSVTRTTNAQLFFNIDCINDAIKKGMKVSFLYCTYNEKGELVPRKNGERYIVSPYYLINSQGNYYLLCNHNKKTNPITTFRVDLIKEIEMEDNQSIPLNSFLGMEDFNVAQYLNEHIYPFGGEVVNASIEILKENTIQYVIDWFGDKAFLSKSADGNIIANVRCDESALFYWLLQYGEGVRLLSPQKLKNKLAKHYQAQADMYR